jgi:hypothetical protein
MQAWPKTVGPSPSMCSLNRMPAPALVRMDASVALAQVFAVQLDQVEAVEEHAVIIAVVANVFKRRHAIVIARDRLSIDDAGARAQAGQRFDDQWEAPRQLIARAAVQPHARAILASNDPEAVVLNLMQPQLTGRRLLGFCRQARLDEPGRQGTRTRQHMG